MIYQGAHFPRNVAAGSAYLTAQGWPNPIGGALKRGYKGPWGPPDGESFAGVSLYPLSAPDGDAAVGPGTIYCVGMTLHQAVAYIWRAREAMISFTINATATAREDCTVSDTGAYPEESADKNNWSRSPVDDYRKIYSYPQFNNGGYDIVERQQTLDLYPEEMATASATITINPPYVNQDIRQYELGLIGPKAKYIIPFWDGKYWFPPPVLSTLVAHAFIEKTEGTPAVYTSGEVQTTVTPLTWDTDKGTSTPIPLTITGLPGGDVTADIPARTLTEVLIDNGESPTTEASIVSATMSIERFFTYGGSYNETTGARV